MTVAGQITDEKLAEIIKGCEGVTPGPWKVYENRIINPAGDAELGNWTIAEAWWPVHREYLARLDPQTVLSLLTELQHRREAEVVAPGMAKFAAEWHGICQTIAVILELPEPEIDFASKVRDKFDALAASPSSPASGVRVKALADVAAERQRQMDVEGWTLEHDDEHNRGEIAYAAACYALATRLGFGAGWLRPIIERLWPWSESWWRPTKPRRNLVKAGALILAEIERLDRLSALGKHP